ncbi:MAG: C39 family peptidase [Proteobacteria bacterium]|nr:C39 family peptidase [Pseudomonadota bacterium]
MRHELRFLLLALCLGGCATRPTSTIDAFAQNSANNSFEVLHRSFRPDGLVLPVVHDRQQEPQSCGANALASVVNYWRGAQAVSGQAIYTSTPPSDRRGYNLNELVELARSHGLLASAVRLDRNGIVRELENGRPVLVPVLVPAVFVASRSAPGEDAPVVGLVARNVVGRVGWVQEHANLGMVSHYLVVAGYDAHRFVVVDPVRGYRTITFDRFERYRRPYADAALVLSGSRRPPGAGLPVRASN